MEDDLFIYLISFSCFSLLLSLSNHSLFSSKANECCSVNMCQPIYTTGTIWHWKVGGLSVTYLHLSAFYFCDPCHYSSWASRDCVCVFDAINPIWDGSNEHVEENMILFVGHTQFPIPQEKNHLRPFLPCWACNTCFLVLANSSTDTGFSFRNIIHCDRIHRGFIIHEINLVFFSHFSAAPVF